MIVLISVYTPHSILLLEVVVDKELEDLGVDGDLREADEDAAGDPRERDLVEPAVLSNVSYLKSLLGVRVEDRGN